MLAAPPHFGLLRGPAGDLILRPWFDSVAVRIVTDWYVPLSRVWAAASVSNGYQDMFARELGAGGIRDFSDTLSEMMFRQARYVSAEEAWETVFFADAPASADQRVEIETERADAADHYMAMRGKFISLRKKAPRIKWDVAPPAKTQEKLGGWLENPFEAFQPGPPVPVAVSPTVPSAFGTDGWIRQKSPVLGDNATARVFYPKGKARGTLIWLHGVGMEPEMWKTLTDPVMQLVEAGYCVIQPEGPWHGRRTPNGRYGGEIVFAKGVSGFIDLFRSWIVETAHWTAWARENVSSAVGIGGLSLGALTSQLLLSVCGNWPDEMKPDASLLVTTTRDVIGGALQGSLSERLGIVDALRKSGWTDAEIRRWSSFVEPGAAPAIPPEKVVMLLGTADTVTPFAGGNDLANQWNIPSQNRFVRRQGHFSGTIGLYRNPAPLFRTAAILD